MLITFNKQTVKYINKSFNLKCIWYKASKLEIKTVKRTKLWKNIADVKKFKQTAKSCWDCNVDPVQLNNL